MEVIRLLLLVFGIASSRFIENTETRKLITEIKPKLKYGTQNQNLGPTYAEGLDDTPPCWAPQHVILRVQRPDGDMKVLLIVR